MAAVGLDLGVAQDAAVAALVRRQHETGFILVEALYTWQPRQGRRVDLQEVEVDVAVLAKRQGAPLVLDPWQAMLMGQRLQSRGVRVEEICVYCR